MKKKFLWLILCLCFMAGVLTGCGDVTLEDYDLVGNVKDYGEWNGLSWQFTDKGELVVVGYMEDPYLKRGYHTSKGETYWSWSGITPWINYKSKVTTAYLGFSGAESLAGFFNEYSNLTKVDLEYLDTSAVTDMNCMFDYCESLTDLDLSSFDTRNVTNMSSMFEGCESLTDLDLSSFDTRNVTDMNCMFRFCHSLTDLDLRSLDTSNVTNMEQMFYGCRSLTDLDLLSFDTSNVTDMEYMFNTCNELKEVLVGSDWKEAKYSDYMFDNCPITDVTYK